MEGTICLLPLITASAEHLKLGIQYTHSAFRRVLFASISQSPVVMELRQTAWGFARKTLALAWLETVRGADDILSGNIDF